MFKRYPSIENSYREKTIHMFLKYYEELKDERFVIQEKYDGSNISLIFYPNGNFKIASRNRIIKPDEDFNDIWSVIKKDEYKELTEYGYYLAIINNKIFQFYGEIYGQGIQKRINYGPDKYICIFDVCSYYPNNEYEVFWHQYKIYNDPILSKYLVQTYTVINGLNDALKYKPDNFDEIEGIVIKPYDNVYFSPQGSIFYLKNKNPKFREKENKIKKDNKPKFSDDVENLHKIFGSYINKNRVLSVFSKEGEIKEEKEIGKYIKLIIEDAKDDFLKDNEVDLSKFSKKEEKYIFNHSKNIVPIF